MSSPVPKDDELWLSIARFMYSGAAAFAVFVIIAFVRDFSRSSRVNASSNNYTLLFLHWYYRFSVRYRDTHVFYYVEFVRLTSNLIICALYVLGTYHRNVPKYTSVVYRLFGSVFVIDLLIHILIAESAISTVFKVNVLIEAISFPSLFLSKDFNDYLNFAFLRAVPAFCAYARLERRLFVHIFSQNRLLIKLCFKTLTLFYTLAASIQLLEIPGDLLTVRFREDWGEYGDWSFMNSAYFIIVTLSTVGYGDFSPSTIQGRIYTLLIIIIGIIVFSSVISELVEQANRDRGSGYFIKNTRTRHVIVTGNPNLNDLVHFVSEFYSDSRQSNVSAKIVVLVESPEWSETEWFQYIARNQFLQSRLQFIMGTALNTNDLHRARLDTADAVFMLTSPSNGEDLSLQDTSTVIRVLAIRNVRSDIPIYAQTLLEESNLQSHLALSTVSCDARISGSKLRFEKERERCARYDGLYNSVLMSEFRDLPRMHHGTVRRHRENILNQYKQRNTFVNIHEVDDPQAEALRKSQNVCLQEIQMALISGNINANGVGTLLSNMYLDVQTAKLTKEDPGWLHEYLMGATASLMYTIVPDELDGVCVKDIANDMFHLGLLLFATSDPVNVLPMPVLSTNETLRKGDLVMILSYHERIYIADAFYLVALRCSRGELRFAPQFDINSKGEVSRDGPRTSMISDLLTFKSRWTRHEGQRRDTPPFLQTPPPSRSWVSPSLTHIKVNTSADDLDALADANEHDEDSGTFLHKKGIETRTEKQNEPYIPDGLKGHVIVAMEGDAPLQNLPLLLRNLWHKDNRRALRGRKRARIVVIHPCIKESIRKRFQRFEGSFLFFLEGSPASRATWRKAKLGTAAAVTTMADIMQQTRLSDARTIFTILTLDVSTANDQNLFICSELVDEQSLEYLREPTHPRRRGAELGEPSDRLASMYFDVPSNRNVQAMPKQTQDGSQEITPNTKPEHGKKSRSRTITFDIQDNSEQDAEESTPSKSVRLLLTEGRQGSGKEAKEGKDGSSSGNAFSRLASKALPSRHKHLVRLASGKGPVSVISGDAKSTMVALGPEVAVSGTLEGTDPNNRPGAARARRSTLFSRSRYASGELLVQSSAITLLAREYIEPGFVTFFTNILGTDASHPGMKIRLVRIPKALFDPSRGYTCKEGRPLIRYNDVFQILISLGVTPLGIYRSGNAPVLVPWKMRRKRGAAISQELEPMLERMARESDAFHVKDAVNPLTRSFKKVLKKMAEVDPSKQRENQGREEIHGHMQHLFSMESSDEDFSGSEDEQFNHDPKTLKFQNAIRQPSEAHEDIAVIQDGQAETADMGTDANLKKPLSLRLGLNMFKRDSQQISGDDNVMPAWGGEKPASPRYFYNTDPALEVPGRAKYSERHVAENLLPYVYTLPEPNTWCAETDGIFILCDPSFDLPGKWMETANEMSPQSHETLEE